MREFYKIIELPAFRYHITVIVSESVAKSRIARNNVLGVYGGGEDTDNNPAGMHSGVKGKNRSFLFFRFNPTVGELSHECFHCIWRMMNWIGAELENEVVAYHLTYLTDEIWKFAKYAESLPDPDPDPEKQLEDLAAAAEAPRDIVLDTNVVEKHPTDAEIDGAFI